jgi:hypothetical protein
VIISINKMGPAGILLAIAMCCGAPVAHAQLYMSVGPGMSNSAAQRSPTSNLGLGGPGSSTEVQGLNEPAIGSNRGSSFPLLNQQPGQPLGVTGNSTGTSSLSSAGSSSPVNSVTNSLTGPVSNLASPSTNSAATPAAKRKQTNNAAAASSGSRGAAAQVSSSKSP